MVLWKNIHIVLLLVVLSVRKSKTIARFKAQQLGQTLSMIRAADRNPAAAGNPVLAMAATAIGSASVTAADVAVPLTHVSATEVVVGIEMVRQTRHAAGRIGGCSAIELLASHEAGRIEGDMKVSGQAAPPSPYQRKVLRHRSLLVVVLRPTTRLQGKKVARSFPPVGTPTS